MICNVAGIVIFLSVCGIVSSSPDRAIDCRKFVFAPMCRGVAAKRGILGNWYNAPALYIDEKSFRDLLRNIYLAIEKPRVAEEEEEEEDRDGKSTNKQEETENPIRKYQQERAIRFLRLLMGGRRIQSETDNVPSREFDNL